MILRVSLIKWTVLAGVKKKIKQVVFVYCFQVFIDFVSLKVNINWYQPIKESFFSLFFMEQKNKTVTFEIVRAIKQESCLMLLQNHCILDQSIEHIHVEYQL